MLVDAKNHWGSTVEMSARKAKGKPMRVRLKPCGSAQVRFLDAEGKPLADFYPGLFLELAPKRVELAHQLVPNTKALAALNNPKFPPAVAEISDLQVAAHSVGLDVTVLDASDESEIDAAFSVLSRNKVGSLIIAADPFLLGQREQIVELAARHKIPRRRL